VKAIRSFERLFKYVWPQWPRLIIIVISAMIIGVLFAFSVGTSLPLLKVVMNEEGIHGWIDRTISNERYGVSFYLPDKIDLSNPDNTDMLYHLRVTGIVADSPAEDAGLQENDLIVGLASHWVGKQKPKISSGELLKTLATIKTGDKFTVQFRRIENRELQLKETKLKAAPKPFYANTAQKLVSFVPRDQTQAGTKRAVTLIIILLVVVTAIRCFARFWQDYTVQKVVHTTCAHLREDMFRNSMAIPAGFFVSQGGSDTVSRLIRDAQASGNGIKVLFGKALRDPMKAFCVVGVAVAIDYKLTLIFLAGSPVALYVLGNLGRKMKKATRKTLLAWSKMLGKLTEVVNSVKVVKVYNRQEDEDRAFTGISRELLKQQFKIAKVDSIAGPVLEALGMIAGSAGLLIAINWVFNNRMEASEFFTLLLALGVSADSLRKTSSVWNKIQNSNAAAERVFSVIDRKPEEESPNAYQLEPLRQNIEFRDVTFTYPDAQKPALRNVNLIVEAGCNTAIVGPNGSGKTTLANLIPRFYDPNNGSIFIDGKDIRNATLKSLRRQIALVTQNITTFHNTIAANIAYGKPGASREEIIQAAKRAYAHEFIAPLPDGYDTYIGEQGAGLSGGQLQRIVIARAILKNPAILIFDEATSQVDADSEAKIHKAIEEVMHHRTSFVIAHRFSTVINADVIVVMGEGEIIARGDHKTLMETCNLYRSLYDTQLVSA